MYILLILDLKHVLLILSWFACNPLFLIKKVVPQHQPVNFPIREPNLYLRNIIVIEIYQGKLWHFLGTDTGQKTGCE